MAPELDVYKEWLGIPEGPRPPDHYQLLRLVRFEDDLEKINAHYKKLNAHVRKYASGQYYALSQDLLNELAKAKLCLTDPDRKRQYDESLGRTFEKEAERPGPKPLDRVLLDQKLLSREQVAEVREYAEARGLSIRDAVVQMKLLDQEAATQALAQSLGLSYVDLDEVLPDDSVLDKLPRSLVKRHSVLPLFADDSVLLVACVHEPTPDLEDDIRLRFGMPMRAVIATPRAVNQGIAKYYASGMRDESAAQESAAAGSSTAQKQKQKAKPARKPFSQLSPGEQRERKQYGILFICWSVIGSALIADFLFRVQFRLSGLSLWLGHIVTLLLISSVVTSWVFRSYWK